MSDFGKNSQDLLFADEPQKGLAVRTVLFRGIDGELDYLVPQPLEGVLKIGSMAKVPLRGGAANAIVTSIFPASELDGKFAYKKIAELVQPEPVLTPELVKIAFWMRDYYGCGMQNIFEAMIPAVVRAGKSALEAKRVTLVKVFSQDEMQKLERRAKSQAATIKTLAENGGTLLLSALLKMSGTSWSTVDAIAKKGFVKIDIAEITRTSFDDELSKAEMVSSSDKILNEEQRIAFDAVCGDIAKLEFAPRLLYGITGSGKTEVYIRAMKEALADGGSCIFLVPEISLTPQTVGRLKSRLDNCGLVVWHSGLSDGQRLDAWRALARGESRVVVGARSCIFAPLENLKLIVVDEEHDSAYKQENAPRYNARDVAILRAKFSKCACLLGSATPAVETLNNAETGKYAVSRITHRADNAKLPRVFITDMMREKAGAVLSRLLIDKISQRLDNREQVILFLNRRGYSKIFECPDCGYVEECPHCSVSMTWHRNEDIVKCHICGHTAPAPLVCPDCGSQKARWHGHGTQKVEEFVSKLFQSARVGRMDRDSMKKRDNYRKILGDFRMGKLDILIGTQMIAKGLDFPRVTLVGIIDADTALHMPDFRAAERTFQMIVQVSGRAGRGGGEGDVIIQTRNPEASAIQYAKNNDLKNFLEEDLAARREFGYPPYNRIIRQIFRARDERRLSQYAKKFADAAKQNTAELCEIRGPAPAPIERSEDFFRWHLLYFCKNVRPVVSKILEIKSSINNYPDVEDVLDVDPFSLM